MHEYSHGFGIDLDNEQKVKRISGLICATRRQVRLALNR